MNTIVPLLLLSVAQQLIKAVFLFLQLAAAQQSNKFPSFRPIVSSTAASRVAF
uniref:Uncharacterized protein n=1 Tax=Arundo donax TaxID=35708 RepID=A0A0A9BKN5_ARUDO